MSDARHIHLHALLHAGIVASAVCVPTAFRTCPRPCIKLVPHLLLPSHLFSGQVTCRLSGQLIKLCLVLASKL